MQVYNTKSSGLNLPPGIFIEGEVLRSGDFLNRIHIKVINVNKIKRQLKINIDIAITHDSVFKIEGYDIYIDDLHSFFEILLEQDGNPSLILYSNNLGENIIIAVEGNVIVIMNDGNALKINTSLSELLLEKLENAVTDLSNGVNITGNDY